MVVLAMVGGLIGGLCILYAAFIVIAESIGWAIRRYGAAPMWRIRKNWASKR